MMEKEKEKKYAVKWKSGETINYYLTNDQAENLKIVEIVESVILIKNKYKFF